MTARNDRRHRIQQYPIPLVKRAIADTVYGDDNVRIVTDLYIGNQTHEQVAESAHLSTRGLYKRLDSIMPSMENYLRKLN